MIDLDQVLWERAALFEPQRPTQRDASLPAFIYAPHLLHLPPINPEGRGSGRRGSTYLDRREEAYDQSLRTSVTGNRQTLSAGQGN